MAEKLDPFPTGYFSIIHAPDGLVSLPLGIVTMRTAIGNLPKGIDATADNDGMTSVTIQPILEDGELTLSFTDAAKTGSEAKLADPRYLLYHQADFALKGVVEYRTGEFGEHNEDLTIEIAHLEAIERRHVKNEGWVRPAVIRIYNRRGRPRNVSLIPRFDEYGGETNLNDRDVYIQRHPSGRRFIHAFAAFPQGPLFTPYLNTTGADVTVEWENHTGLIVESITSVMEPVVISREVFRGRNPIIPIILVTLSPEGDETYHAGRIMQLPKEK